MDVRDKGPLFLGSFFVDMFLNSQPQPCAERVLMTLANQYRDFVTPMITEAFRGIISQRSHFF